MHLRQCDIKWIALYTARVYTYISTVAYALDIKYSTRITSLWTQKVTYFSALYATAVLCKLN